jgi:hypothetical protein
MYLLGEVTRLFGVRADILACCALTPQTVYVSELRGSGLATPQ